MIDQSVDNVAGVPVLAYVDEAIRPIGSAGTVAEAMDSTVGRLQASIDAARQKRFRIGVGHGDADHSRAGAPVPRT